MKTERLRVSEDLEWENPFDKAPEIEEDAWVYSDGGVLTTARAQSCTLVAVHDPYKHDGFLGHFRVNIDMPNQPPFDEMLEAVRIKKRRRMHRQEAWISGASTLDMPHFNKEHLDIYHELIELNRKDTMQALGELGMKVGVAWLRDNESIAGLVYDTANGNIVYGVNKHD